jgi:hypothetical protein
MANSDASDGGRFSLLSNPFVLLRISANASAQNIKSAYEDAVEDSILGIDVLQRAQQELLTPRLRINAEVGGLIDVAPNLASQLISRLQTRASHAELADLIASLHALPKSNILAHLASQAIATENDLMELLNAQSTVAVGGTCDAINDAREQAGFVRTDQDSVAKALAALEERQIRSVVDRAATNDSFAKAFISFVNRVLGANDHALTTKLAVYVAAYGQAMAPALSVRREAVITACGAVRRNPRSIQSLERIARELRRWNDIAHPIKLFESHMNRDDTQARDLFMQVRDLCIWLANEQQMYEAARSITQCCSDVFKELPRAIEQMREEIQTLSQLSLQKAANTLLDPLCKVLEEAQKSHRQLEKDLLKNGFGSRSSGIVKKLYDEFTKAVSITAGTELADLPWRLVREAAISLNNDSQSPGAAARLVDGLVSYFSLHRPSNDVVTTLKNDQDAARKNILQQDLVENLKHGRLSNARTLAGKLIEIEKGAEELAALKQMRDVIAAKQRSNRIRGWGWFAAAVGLVFFVAIGSQEKGSGSTAPSNRYSPPSYSPPPSQRAEAPPQKPNTAPLTTAYMEERPPVGRGLSLTQANIRYCEFQGVRLESARSFVSAQSDVLWFNSLVDDWNSRCASYRYRPPDKSAVDAEVSTRRPVLQAEGRALFRRSEATAR